MSDPVNERTTRRRVEMQRARKARRRQEIVGVWRRYPRLALGVLVAVLLMGGVLLASAVLRDYDRSAGGLDTSSAPEAVENGPYDLSQASAGFDLGSVVQAKFLSLSFPGEDGLRSMMLTRDRPEFQEMATAIAGAEKAGNEAPEMTDGEDVTLTFVTAERETASLRLGEGSLFYWRGTAYRAAGDLQEMVGRAGRLLD